MAASEKVVAPISRLYGASHRVRCERAGQTSAAKNAFSASVAGVTS